MALYDDLMAMVQADPSKYSDAVNQLTQAAGGQGLADYRQIANLASAAQSRPDYYTNTTTPVSHVTGIDASGNPTMSAGISTDAAANPYYAQGGAGYGITQSQIGGFLPAMQAAGGAVPPTITSNPDGSATASFAGGGSQTVTDPNALQLLQQAYPSYGQPSPIPTPPVGGGMPPVGGSQPPSQSPPSPPPGYPVPPYAGGPDPFAQPTQPSGPPPGYPVPAYAGGPNPFPAPTPPGPPAGYPVPPYAGGPEPRQLSQQLPPDYLSGMPGASYGNGTGTPANPYLAGTGLDNPAVGSMLDANRYQTNLGLNDAFNAIRSNAIGTGGLGGTRQGVAQGVAIGRAMGGLAGQNAGLLGGLYENQQNRDLSRYQGDQGFYTAQRGQDLQQTGLGANLWQMGVQGPWNALNSAGTIFDTTAGLNTTGMQQGQQGGGLPGAVGGALGTWALGNRAGLWGNSTTPATNPAGTGSYDWTGMGWAF